MMMLITRNFWFPFGVVNQLFKEKKKKLREICETSASALTLPSSKATYICHNEEWAIFYHQAAFHH